MQDDLAASPCPYCASPLVVPPKGAPCVPCRKRAPWYRDQGRRRERATTKPRTYLVEAAERSLRRKNDEFLPHPVEFAAVAVKKVRKGTRRSGKTPREKHLRAVDSDIKNARRRLGQEPLSRRIVDPKIPERSIAAARRLGGRDLPDKAGESLPAKAAVQEGWGSDRDRDEGVSWLKFGHSEWASRLKFDRVESKNWRPPDADKSILQVRRLLRENEEVVERRYADLRKAADHLGDAWKTRWYLTNLLRIDRQHRAFVRQKAKITKKMDK